MIMFPLTFLIIFYLFNSIIGSTKLCIYLVIDRFQCECFFQTLYLRIFLSDLIRHPWLNYKFLVLNYSKDCALV